MSYTIYTFIFISLGVCLLSFLFAIWLYHWVKNRSSENKRIAEIGVLIRNGAKTFLVKEYKVLAKFAGVITVLILLFLPKPVWTGSLKDFLDGNLIMAAAYLAGTIFSAIAGVIGMHVATIANVKTAEAAKQGIKPSFMAGFRGGARRARDRAHRDPRRQCERGRCARLRARARRRGGGRCRARAR